MNDQGTKRNEPDFASGQEPWLKKLVLFGVAFLLWVLLVWPVSPVDGRILLGDVVAGIVVAAFVAVVMREIIRVDLVRVLQPARWLWALVYVFVFAFYVIKGGLDVAYRVLHPAMPIRPGIVKMPSLLKTDSARTLLANSITLTPGTLTIEVTGDGVFYVHWLNVCSEEEEEIARQVLRRFEWFIQRILE